MQTQVNAQKEDLNARPLGAAAEGEHELLALRLLVGQPAAALLTRAAAAGQSLRSCGHRIAPEHSTLAQTFEIQKMELNSACKCKIQYKTKQLQ